MKVLTKLALPVWRMHNTWFPQHVFLHRSTLLVQLGLHGPSNLLAVDVADKNRNKIIAIKQPSDDSEIGLSRTPAKPLHTKVRRNFFAFKIKCHSCCPYRCCCCLVALIWL